MAEQAVHNVLNGKQSMGLSGPVDEPENTPIIERIGGGSDKLGDTDKSESNPNIQATEVNGLVDPASVSSDVESEERPLDAPVQSTPHPQVNGVKRDDETYLTRQSIDSGSEQSPVMEHHDSHDDLVQDGSYGDVDWRRRDSNDVMTPPDPRERSNSIKKPTSFKAVSVTKNFLAKSVGGAAAFPKLGGDKGVNGQSMTDTSISARPRLVAKSGRDARASGLAKLGAPGGPDASKVWNRNRPLPPAPPKQFTDEELKQQYGIHLATRLQADEPGKGAKWADMEDDEDDWAPDTVEWMDGTKSSLQPSENEKGQTSSAAPPNAEIQSEDSAQPHSDASQILVSTIGPGKTILRPGARATAAQVRPGLVLKSVPENAPPVPKPATPGPSRSPWASLPPVDKASPISFNVPLQKEQSRLASFSSESDALPNGRVMQSPTREIAADTFDRSWRDSDRGSRELFDSRSGRYEPVKTPRRSSMRQEGGFRPPAVLQRPSQSNTDVDHSLRQGSRMTGSQDARTWDRRGSSSAVDDRTRPDRSSVDASVASNDVRSDARHSPVSTKTNVSDQHNSAATPSHEKVDATSNPRAYSAHGPPDGAIPGMSKENNTDVAAMQQQIMRQKLEANRRRKEEEQAREEAAKQERIKQRLLALGDLPKKPEQAVTATEAAPTKSDTVLDKPSKPTSSRSQSSKEQKQIQDHLQQNHEEVTPHLDGLGAIPADSVRKAPSGLALVDSTMNRHATLLQPNVEMRPPVQLQTSATSPRVSQIGAEPLSKSTSDLMDSASSVPSQSRPPSDSKRFPSVERQTQQWGRGPSGFPTSQGWTTGGPAHAATSASVWGPPSKDKSLGNGAFDSDMPRVPTIGFSGSPQSAQQPMQNQGPGPIAPPNPSPRPNGQQMHTDHNPSNSYQPPHPEWASPEIPVHQQASRTPFSRDMGRINNQSIIGQPPGRPQATGSNYLNDFRLAERALNEQEQQNPRGEQSVNYHPILHETYRRTAVSDILGGEQKVISVRNQTIGGNGDRPPPLSESLSGANLPLGNYAQFQQGYRPQPPQSNVRTSSRFFSGPSNQLSQHVNPAMARSGAAARPTIESQSAGVDDELFVDENDRRSSHPKVHLPKARPIVKLPTSKAVPSSTYSSHPVSPELISPRNTGMPHRQQPTKFGQQPIVQNAEWQNRFDFVTGRKATQTPASPAFHSRQSSSVINQTPLPLVVTSSATAPLELDGLQTPATVSLPQKKNAVNDPLIYTLPHSNPQTTPGYLWDEPEATSQPTVVLPRILSNLSWDSTPSPWKSQAARTGSKPFQVQSGSHFDIRFDTGRKITIHLPGQEPTVKELIREDARFGPRQSKPQQKPKRKPETKPKSSSVAGDPSSSKQVDDPKPSSTTKRIGPRKPTKQQSSGQRNDSPMDGKQSHAEGRPANGERQSRWPKVEKGKKINTAANRTETRSQVMADHGFCGWLAPA